MVGLHFPKSAPARLVDPAVELEAVELEAAEPVLASVLGVVELELPELELAEPVELLAAALPPVVEGSALLPLASTVVKLLKPLAAMTCATDMPVALKGVLRDVFELAISVSDPTTAGSTRGTMPRSSAVAGRVASPQMEGTLTEKGLKFCSAATSPAAALITCGSVPRVETILSAWVSYMVDDS